MSQLTTVDILRARPDEAGMSMPKSFEEKVSAMLAGVAVSRMFTGVLARAGEFASTRHHDNRG